MVKKHLIAARTRTITATKRFRRELKKAMITAISAAFGFLIAFMWRDAISQYIKGTLAKLGLPESSFYSFIAAILVTILCVVGIMIVSRWAAKQENEINKPIKTIKSKKQKK